MKQILHLDRYLSSFMIYIEDWHFNRLGGLDHGLALLVELSSSLDLFVS